MQQVLLSRKPAAGPPEPGLAGKVAFLSEPKTYGSPAGGVVRRETHMSWVFLAGERVYKLKKPVRFAYLDFSTLARREAACRAEVKLNRRLAPDVYLEAVPLVWSPRGFSIGGAGEAADWLVVMRRLGEDGTLEQKLLDGRARSEDLERLFCTLSRFYRHAGRVHIAPAQHIADWRRNLRENNRVLSGASLPIPPGLARRIQSVQRRFIEERSGLLAARARENCIVDGHGDLRPEHIWLDHMIRIIDCLEFNAKLRAIDPLDEIAFLTVESDRLGAHWAGSYLQRRILAKWGDHNGRELFCFYRCYRASLRARLAIAHLAEPNPRTPEKWLPLAKHYLQIAVKDALLLEQMLNRRGIPQSRRRNANAGLIRREAPRTAAHRA